jgi:hypothetical protein
VWSAVGSIVLGITGWLVASFFGKPLVEFLDLRRKVHEEIVYTGNVSTMSLEIPEEKRRYEAAFENLRRLGAKVQATNVASSWPLRLFLRKTGYNLAQAGGGLIGLSNSLHLEDGSKAIQRNSIQKGLRLPVDYTDQQIKDIVRTRPAAK